MKRGKHSKKSEKKSSFWIVVFFILLVLGVSIYFFLSTEEKGLGEDTKINSSVNGNSIAIPGYEGLTLKADTKNQELSLKNPAENNCYFVISIYLEDGTRIWKSDYIKPGEVSKTIKLSQPLSKGNYSAKLKYECFSLDEEKTPKNGAEINLTLRVK